MYTPRGRCPRLFASFATVRLASTAISPAWLGEMCFGSGGAGMSRAASWSSSHEMRSGSGCSWTR